MELTTVDLTGLGTALDSFSESESWFINSQSGEVRRVSHEVCGEGGISVGCEEGGRLRGCGWLEVGFLSQATKYQDAQDFVARLRDADFREFLRKTLDTTLSLYEHRFEQTLLSFPIAQRYWRAFKAARLARHAIAWLHAHNLLTAEEAEVNAASFPDPDRPPGFQWTTR